jgi:hypothetical protein
MIRPTFLTVLCVLTFIGSGYSIFNAISSYSSADVAVGLTQDVMDEAMDKIEDEAESEKEAALANKILGSVSEGMTAPNIKNSAIASGISALLTLIGAILMWSLNKKGFYLYVIGVAVGILAPMLIFGGILGAASSGVLAFVGVLFSVLYGLNLKHMH